MAYKLTKEMIETVVRRGAQALADYCQRCGIHYVVTGSSGGLDSAVILGFAQRACQIAEKQGFKLTSVGLIMPCHSDSQAELLGRKAIEQFGAKEIRIDLSDVFDYAYTSPLHQLDQQIRRLLEETQGQKALAEWDWSQKIAQGNIMARLRMIFGTYHVARMLKGMVLSTDNLSEFWMAFWTICGDVGDFGIIQQMLKGFELYDIARYLEVPQEIIAARPDDGLGVTSGGDEGQLGASYPVVDRVMITLIQHGFDPDGSLDQLDCLPDVKGVSPEIVRKLASRCLKGAFKRHGTIVLSREELGLPLIKIVLD